MTNLAVVYCISPCTQPQPPLHLHLKQGQRKFSTNLLMQIFAAHALYAHAQIIQCDETCSIHTCKHVPEEVQAETHSFMKKYVIRGSLAMPALFTCRTFYCLLHRVCLFIDRKSLEWRFYSKASVRLSVFPLSCQSEPPPPTSHMPELGGRQTGWTQSHRFKCKSLALYSPSCVREFWVSHCVKRGEMSKSPLITADPDSLFSLPPPLHTRSSISSSLYPCGIGLSPNCSDDTFEMQNGFQVNQPGLFFTPVCHR